MVENVDPLKPHPTPIPTREGTAGWRPWTLTDRTRKQEWGRLGPSPAPSLPGAPPTVSISREIGATRWCSHPPGGGGGKGSPGDPPPRGSSEDGAHASWAVPPPPAHQEPPLAVVRSVPKHRKPKAGFGHTVPLPSPRGCSPHPGHLRVGRPHTYNTGNGLLALTEPTCPSVHPSVHPSVLVPSQLPSTASWLGTPVMAACAPPPPHHTPRPWPRV